MLKEESKSIIKFATFLNVSKTEISKYFGNPQHQVTKKKNKIPRRVKILKLRGEKNIIRKLKR